MKSYVGTGVGKEGKSVCCAEMNVKVLVMYCGNVQHIVAIKLTFCCSCRQALEVVIYALKLGVISRKLRSF